MLNIAWISTLNDKLGPSGLLNPLRTQAEQNNEWKIGSITYADSSVQTI
jgi:hypothetical protein